MPFLVCIDGDQIAIVVHARFGAFRFPCPTASDAIRLFQFLTAA